MSHGRPGAHSSHPSVRYSPYYRLYASPSAQRPSVPPGQHSLPSDRGRTANNPPAGYLSPASVYFNHPVNHPSTLHPNHPSSQSSFHGHHGLEFSNFPNYSFPPESAPIPQITSYPPVLNAPYPRLLQQSAHPAQLPFPQRLGLQSTADVPYPSSAVSGPTHLPSNSQPRHATQPSFTLRQPENAAYGNQNYWNNQQPLQNSQRPAQTFPHHVSQSAGYQNQGMFSGSHNLSLSHNIFVENSITSDDFMEKLLQTTIIGAEFDSSDRYPPPRCHPRTRLAIIERCKTFIAECNGQEKIRWVVGPAGVGKSAIMQMVAEETPADVSVFFSVNGRQDGWRTLTTIAYQLAVKYEPYRQFIRSEIARDPSLLRKLLPAQFNKFIVEPFIHRHLFDPSRRFLIIIDGLDECDNPITPLELLELISNFCLSYPTSPVVWFIASRPEPHITSFFDRVAFLPAYQKEEIIIDSDEGCKDVQLYLRSELQKLKDAHPILRLKREWPSELVFTKIATAAGGLFAYASTMVRYIGDPHYQNPATQLSRVLEDIDTAAKNHVSAREHSMAQLDALYQRVLSNIPEDVMINTRKLLLSYSDFGWNRAVFRVQCNILGLTDDTAYGAVCHLHAVMKVPAPDKADEEPLELLHKSFSDFLFNSKRSRFCRNVRDDVEQLRARSSARIIKEVPDDFDNMARDEDIACNQIGHLKSGRGFLDNIPLSWPSDERSLLTDNWLRRQLYIISMEDICAGFSHTKCHATMSNFDVLTTRFAIPGPLYPFYQLRSAAFGKFYPELMQLGKLKQVPLRAMDYAAICGAVTLQFMGPVFISVQRSDPWNSSCQHQKSERDNGWATDFSRSLVSPRFDGVVDTDHPRFNSSAGKDSHRQALSASFLAYDQCLYCSRRLARHFIDNPDQLATVFIDSTGMCYVELVIDYPDDGGMSKLRYWFFHSGPPLCTS